VRTTVADVNPDLVVLDMQIGNMGGVAVALDLRLEESAGRLDRANILLLLDREADEFIARRADVDLMLLKPVDAGILRRAAKQLIPA
jgi:DNA-binding response OmpR family regulator